VNLIHCRSGSSPCLQKLVELVPALQTTSETLERARAFAQACGKETTESKDVPGFVSNALLCPFLNEAVMCLEKVGRSCSWTLPATDATFCEGRGYS
jgi:3-hydroxyacyl-CoA dehydrogenase